MNRYTPGPWEVRGQYIIGNELGGFVCTWSGRSANAHLIAAAPDMLAMLEELEWSGANDQYDYFCLVCDRLRHEGHAEDCTFSNLLKRIKGEILC